jgi:hypothetical protein
MTLPKVLYQGIKNPQFVYELLDPMTQECRYIGKTKNLKNRYEAHLQQSIKKRTYKECWISSLLSNNKKPIMRVIAITTIDNVNRVECREISLRSNLTNATLGGDGQSNMLQATITKMRITLYKKRNKLKRIKGKKSKDVVGYNMITGEIITFKSTIEAASYIKSSNGTVAAHCRRVKNYKTCKKHIFRYIGE